MLKWLYVGIDLKQNTRGIDMNAPNNAPTAPIIDRLDITDERLTALNYSFGSFMREHNNLNVQIENTINGYSRIYLTGEWIYSDYALERRFNTMGVISLFNGVD